MTKNVFLMTFVLLSYARNLIFRKLCFVLAVEQVCVDNLKMRLSYESPRSYRFFQKNRQNATDWFEVPIEGYAPMWLTQFWDGLSEPFEKQGNAWFRNFNYSSGNARPPCGYPATLPPLFVKRYRRYFQ